MLTNELRTIDNNRNFQEKLQVEEIRIVFSDETKQEIADKEAIAAIDASVKDGIMAGV